MHKKLFLISSFIFAVTMLMSSCLFAAYEDSNTGLYTFNAKVMATLISYEDNGDNWVEIFNYSLADSPSVDVAVGDAGPQMGTFFSGKDIPTGTIKRFKVHTAYNFIVKGWVKSTSNNHYYVTDNTIPTIQTRDFGTSQPSESDCTPITLSVPSGGGDYHEAIQAASGDGIVATEGAAVNISIKFDLGTVITVSESQGAYVIRPSDNIVIAISQI